MNTPYESMAMDIFFNGGNIIELLKKHKMELRAGKETSDFVKAFHKGIDLGRGKFEHEMQQAGAELEKVCKVTK